MSKAFREGVFSAGIFSLGLILLGLGMFALSCSPPPTPLVPTRGPLPTSTLVTRPTPLGRPVPTELPTAAPTTAPTVPPTLLPTPLPAIAAHPGLPLAVLASDDFVGSGNCAACHSFLRDAAGQDVSIDAHWRSAMMANAARDPFWQAKVSSEVARNRYLQGVIESKCASCHMPMAYTQAVVEGSSVDILDGFLQSDHPLHEAAMDGVSCALCHQIQADHLGTLESFSGGYHIDTDTDPPEREIFGPYPDSEQMMMRNTVGFTPLQGEQVDDAALCAACHTLYTPYVDAAGNVLGTFPEQTPYLEWQHSRHGGERSCQACHMPQAEGGVRISNVPRGGQIPARSPFFQHHFVGGNTMMILLHNRYVQEIGLTASTDHFQATLERTVDQLRNNTAEIAIVEKRVAGDTLTVMLELDNLAGHKFPTGFPARRAWIQLTVEDAAGQVVFESGRPQSDGAIAGNDADVDPGTYEPHYDLVISPDQVQIYETVMGTSEGEPTYTLLRGAGYLKDNRLLPDGFDKGTAAPDVAVWGSALQDDSFVGGVDRVTYQVDVQDHQGPFTVVAALLYQSLSYPFVQDLRQDDTPQIKRLFGLYDDLSKPPVVICALRETVE